MHVCAGASSDDLKRNAAILFLAVHSFFVNIKKTLHVALSAV